MNEPRHFMHYRLLPDRSVQPLPRETFIKLTTDLSQLSAQVALDEIGDVTVSTAFVSFNHSQVYGGPPLVFETMVFGDLDNDEDEGVYRYSTWEEAEEGHKRVVEELRARIDPEATHD